MSLLNEALRKKISERGHPKKTNKLHNAPKALKNRKTKIYIVILLIVLISVIGTLYALKLHYLPKRLPLTSTRPVQQPIKNRDLVQSTQVQIEQEPADKKDMNLEAKVSGQLKPKDKQNDNLIAKFLHCWRQILGDYFMAMWTGWGEKKQGAYDRFISRDQTCGKKQAQKDDR